MLSLKESIHPIKSSRNRRSDDIGNQKSFRRIDRHPAMALFVNLAVLFLFSSVAKAIYDLWLRPLWIRRTMARQGIGGPPPHFHYGNNWEVARMKREAKEKPMKNLSHDIFPNVMPHIATWTAAYGKNYLNWYGMDAQLVITEPELIKEVLNNKDKIFHKAPPLSFMKKILGNGLVTSEGDKWANMRKLANHAFHGECLKGMVPDMVDSTRLMLERWKDHEGKEIEVFKEFTILTSEAISRTAFGSSYVEGRNIFEMLTRMSMLAAKNAFSVGIPGIRRIWKTADQVEADRLEKDMRNAVLQIIEKREEKVKAGGVDGFGSDFFGMLIKALRDTDDWKRITVDDLIDECKTFYLAGQETTNAMLAWTTFLLAAHPEWQEAARKEVLNVFGDKDPNSEGVARLRTISMILNESLRLYPPVVALSRKIYQRTQVGDLVIPANTLLYMQALALHHDRELWGEDVHLFKPERFAEGIAKATRNKAAAFFPFGLGTRNCVGFNFALTEAKIALSMILQRHMFTLSPAYVHSPTQFLTTRPQHGVQVILQVV